MIRSFADRRSRDIYHGENSRIARSFPTLLHAKARRLMDKIDSAISPEVLRAPPGNHLKQLKGKMSGCWSIRINDQWRIVFRWEGADAFDICITDYHD